MINFIQRGVALLGSVLLSGPAGAASLRVLTPQPQPGDVLTISITPAAGERLTGARMAAFDTHGVKFFPRGGGALRAFVGFPFDRHGGTYTLQARVRVLRGGVEASQLLKVLVPTRERYFPTQHISMKASTAGTMSKKDALHAEKLLVQRAMQHTHGAPLWHGSWLVPTSGQPTSSYGRRRYVNGKWWGQHNGADIKAGTGSPVHATNSGRVVLSQYLPTLRGNCIVLDHGCNVFSIYMHLSQRLVQPGQMVGRGQVIGRVGATGFVTGAHLHWEVRIGWEPVDPNRVVHNGLQF